MHEAVYDRPGSLITSWPVAAEQLNIIRHLLDPETHGGERPGYLETAVSHIFLTGASRLILKRPMKTRDSDWRTPQARWSWCNERCMRAFEAGEGASYQALPVMRREGGLHLGGPGKLEDCLLVYRPQASARGETANQAQNAPLPGRTAPSTRVIGV
ncbi:MAG: hypothetical protein GVY06_09465 [Alphaproteobacteria bacterium]|jgi:hypothetical protein|nr:hypothetical protein [Alphaproteobacteria bacterium]